MMPPHSEYSPVSRAFSISRRKWHSRVLLLVVFSLGCGEHRPVGSRIPFFLAVFWLAVQTLTFWVSMVFTVRRLNV